MSGSQEKGYFDTCIVFIARAVQLNRRKRLCHGQDGANPVFLTQGDYLVLTPRSNPTAQMIAYMSYIQASRASICSISKAAGRRCSAIFPI
jgi:Tol biopolymer transport system component